MAGTDGLVGHEIPIGARIVFVVDAYCAMTEERPYAAARTFESASQELALNAGTQFDPGVVRTFLKVLEDRDVPARAPGSPTRNVPLFGGAAPPVFSTWRRNQADSSRGARI